MRVYLTVIVILSTFSSVINIEIEYGQCDSINQCSTEKYLFYDVNPPEGFNLRRDVYMRFAIMLYEARKMGKTDWNLVLPPWYRLYHWRSKHKKSTPWRSFFNVDDLAKFVPVVELDDLVKNKLLELDRVFILKNFDNPFENGEFREKWEIINEEVCVYDEFWGYKNITAKEIICVRFQGKTSKLWELIALHPRDKYVMFTHGEIPLHDNYGTRTYWDCRKSMTFNKELLYTAKEYIKKNFKCTENCNYVAVHWRRQDFSHSGYRETPSIIGTAKQIDKALRKLKTNNLFIATDAGNEFDTLLQELSKFNFKVFYYTPKVEEIEKFKDGGVAIIDQIICSYSSYFIGTHESTFTYRIQEEREILGYQSNTTFNRLCPDEGICEKVPQWRIIN